MSSLRTFGQRLKQLYEQEAQFDILHIQYARQPDQTFNYADLLHSAAGYAQALLRASVQPGEVVILILQHGEPLVAAYVGVVLHGAVPSIMPFLTEKLSPEQYRRSLAALFEITSPAAFITYSEFVGEIRQAIPAGKSVKALLVWEDIQPVRAIDFSQLDGFTRQPEDIVLLQHSSGTTGLQKGVALSHRAIFNQLDSYRRALNLTPEDVIVSWLPLYHDMGLIAGFLMPILERIPLVLQSPFDWVRAPYRLMQAVSQYRGTLSWLPNFAYNFCAQKIRDRDLDGVDLSSWRAVSNCSEPMYWKSHQMFLERFRPYGLRPEALTTCYAMAENVFAVTQGGIDRPVTVDPISQRGLLTERVARPPTPDEDAIKMLSAGRPIDNTRVRILDDAGNELPERCIGEIALQSNCMLTDYYRRDDLTAKTFYNGWYLTGDLGYLANEEVYITGRKKDLIIVGGKNIYPQDLENLASEVEGVHPGRVVAFGAFREETGTEEVVIVAEVEENLITDQICVERIGEEVRQRVTRGSDITVGQVMIFGRGWLIKTSSGKIARNANRDKFLAEIHNRMAIG